MEYRILKALHPMDRLSLPDLIPDQTYEVIGEGFQSLNAVWMVLSSEIAKCIHDPPALIDWKIELQTSENTITVGIINLSITSLNSTK